MKDPFVKPSVYLDVSDERRKAEGLARGIRLRVYLRKRCAHAPPTQRKRGERRSTSIADRFG
jgi:hypothetical protein